MTFERKLEESEKSTWLEQQALPAAITRPVTVEFVYDPKTYQRLVERAAIWGETPVEYIKRQVAWINNLGKVDDQKFNEAQQIELRHMKETKEHAVLATHPLHSYILKRGKTYVIDITWRTSPWLDTAGMHPELEGKFWYRLSKSRRNSDMFRQALKDDYRGFTSLKRLKKAINRLFQKYGYSPYYQTRRGEGI